MTGRPPKKSIAALALTLCVAVVLLGLAPLGRSTAQARNAPKGKGHAQPPARGGHRRHATGRRRKVRRKAAHRRAARKGGRSSAPARLVAALCEDGTRPVPAGGGAFSCDDESEPACEEGQRPAASPDGSRLLCEAPAQGGASEANCEDGRPVAAGGGQFSCDDGSEPACEEGREPVPSGDRSSLVCDAVPVDGSWG